ncbi:MAG: BatD family protein [Chloroflexota bacterium]|nr:BatD family protein [Chloroflexota bacterium]
MRRAANCGLFLVSCLLLLVSCAKPIEPFAGVGSFAARSTLDRDTITVGDHVNYTVQVQHPADGLAQFPQLGDPWGALTVLDQAQGESEPIGEGQSISAKTYVVTAFAVGQYEVPTLTVVYQAAEGGDSQEFTVAAQAITVTSVLTDGANAELRDLKPQAALPAGLGWLWWVLGLALISALLALGLVWYNRRRGLAQVEFEPVFVDPRPPEQIAYEELARIDGLNLVPRGKLKQHYTLATDCLRDYLERRFDLAALERTTGEIWVEMKVAGVEQEPAANVRDVLTEADLVKFAKAWPSDDMALSLTIRIRRIVAGTTPEPEPETAEPEYDADSQTRRFADSPIR